MARQLTDFSVLTFDCYGTMIDWEQGIWDALQPVLLHNDCGVVKRDTALRAFAEIESALEASFPQRLYTDLLQDVHAQFAARFDLASTAELNLAFGASLPHWPAFPDSADALRRLKRAFKLVILSNVSREGFAASNRKLGVDFDAVYTAEDIGSYKPSIQNFDYMLERLQNDHGIGKHEILHTAQSLFHDHAPAQEIGLARAWIDRQGLAQGGSWGATAELEDRPDVDFIFPSLVTMADAAGLDR